MHLTPSPPHPYLQVGVSLYVKLDEWFDVWGYFWLAVWYLAAIFENVYVKHVVTSVPMTTWGRSYYQVRFVD